MRSRVSKRVSKRFSKRVSKRVSKRGSKTSKQIGGAKKSKDKDEGKDSDYNLSNFRYNELFETAMNKPIYNSLEKGNIINNIFKDIDILLI